jgi:hypothetical protein
MNPEQTHTEQHIGREGALDDRLPTLIIGSVVRSSSSLCQTQECVLTCECGAELNCIARVGRGETPLLDEEFNTKLISTISEHWHECPLIDDDDDKDLNRGENPDGGTK